MNIVAMTTQFPIQTNEWGATQVLPLGTQGQTRDGRRFRYASAGAVALVPGNMLQAAAPVANHNGVAVQAAAAIGDLTVSVTLGATAATANQYAEGLITIYDSTNKGYSYGIKSHPAASASATLTVTLYSDDPLVTALTTSNHADLVANAYAGVIQTPVTTLTGAVVGGAVAPIAISNFGWIQVGGLFNALIDGTPGVGLGAAVPAAAAGAVKVMAATLRQVGQFAIVGVDTVNEQILLDLP